MVNLRMFALASALLLGIPLAVAAWPDPSDPTVPGGQVVEAYGEVAAYVEDIVIANAPAPETGRTGEFRDEQVVEGHTTFVTLDIRVWHNRTEGTLNITGRVECTHEVRERHWELPIPFVGNAPVPYKIDRAGAECKYGEEVYATPDPFFDPGTAHATPLQPTGRFFSFRTPAGEEAYAREHSFTLITDDGWTRPQEKTYYAYSTPVLKPWIHTDGRPKNFIVPLPEDRLAEMGVDHFQVVFENDVR